MSDLLNKASLVMVPSGYKEDVVYSQIPTNGSGDLSFTRASNGTRVNSAGLVEVCPWNYKSYSEDLTNGVGLQGSTISTITANTTDTTDPFGTNKAEKFDGSSGQLADTYNGIPENSVITSSIYAKAGSVSTFILRLNASFGTTAVATFNLSSGTITATSGDVYLNSTITPVGNGWYRCTITYNFISIPTNRIELNANGSLYFFGWQLNIGSTAKPYFPTTDRLNVPRLTYQNGGGGCPSLLLEKQSTNLTLYSEQIDNAYWAKQGGTATANATTSPDGTQNADLFTENSATEDHAIFDIVTYFVAGTTYTISFYAKANGRTKVELVSANSGTCPSGRFDLVAQTATALGTSFNAKIESVGNGWFRCSVSRVAPNTGLDVPYYAMVQTFGTITYTGNGTSGMYFWGFQSEASSYQTSYIPTTSSSATRVADQCKNTSVSSLIGQTEGVVFVDLVMKNNISSVNRVVSITESNWLSGGSIRVDIQAGNIAVDIVNNNASVGNISVNTAFAQNTRYKIAVAYKTNDCALYMNGTQLGTNTSIGTMPTCSEFYLNELGGGFGGPYEPTEFNQAILFPTRLTNAELASLTTI